MQDQLLHTISISVIVTVPEYRVKGLHDSALAYTPMM